MKKPFTIDHILFILVFLIVFGTIGYSQMQYQASIHNESGVSSTPPLKILSGDSVSSSELTSINWGKLYPDSYKIYYFSVYNDHPQNSMELYLTISDWSPIEMPEYATVTWDLEGTILAPYEIIKATIRLTISENVKNITDFSFDITVTGVHIKP